MKSRIFVAIVVLAIVSMACGSQVPGPTQPSADQSGSLVIDAGSGAKLYLSAGSPVLQSLAGLGVHVVANFSGTGKIKNNMIAAAAGTYNGAQAFLPESPAWIPTSMTGGATVATSKMVLGVTAKVLADLGLKPGDAISIAELNTRINDHSLIPMICNPTQCNSGLLFYLSSLMQISGQTSLELNLADKSDKSNQIIDQAKTLMANLNITTSSTGDARDAMHKSLISGGAFNALWSYEPEVAALDTQLVSEGKEPLYVIYVNGAIDAAQTLVMNPVFGKDAAVKANFDKAANFLTTDKATQTAIAATGWRPSLYGVSVSTEILKPEWGFQADPNVSTNFAPRYDVAMPLMRTYVSSIRKPVVLFYFDDFSGSMMSNTGRDQLVSASQYLFSDAAAADFLDAADGDVTQVYLFDTNCVALPAVKDANPAGYTELLGRIQGANMGGSTSMFACGVAGLQEMATNYKAMCSTTHNCAFIFMTDGGDNQCQNNPFDCTNVDKFNQTKSDLGLSDIPVWAIPFGTQVDMTQLQKLAGDNICKDTLIACFQKIKGSR